MSIRTLIKSLICYKRLPNIKEFTEPRDLILRLQSQILGQSVINMFYINYIPIFFKMKLNCKHRTFYYTLLSLQTCYVCTLIKKKIMKNFLPKWYNTCNFLTNYSFYILIYVMFLASIVFLSAGQFFSACVFVCMPQAYVMTF